MKISIDNILNQIQDFYMSDMWRDRYYRRLDNLNINISLYKECITAVKRTIRNLKFYTYKDRYSSNGLSYNNIIELNSNIDTWEKDPEHFINLIMHEHGHILYNDILFKLAVNINNTLFKNIPPPIRLGNDMDIKYFSDSNEIRQRIIPLVRYSLENKLTTEDTYKYSCKYDDIFSIYPKDFIIYLINNIL